MRVNMIVVCLVLATLLFWGDSLGICMHELAEGYKRGYNKSFVASRQIIIGVVNSFYISSWVQKWYVSSTSGVDIL